MMYSKTDFVKEYIKRTKENLEHYTGKYEVTNLINSAVGLLIIPEQRLLYRITDNWIEDSL